ncbi:glycoside hydrolase family 2 TIM barrel-domain containing protein [Amycolatopsis sp. NPDC059027]|uniref:glycoside hydrolase family 2 TIM barrel-domain containing protein n=1 Tax=Amycolatopsis sp. NPDC059027 TaxID=3346709 RepID=UPI00366B8CC5
MGLVAVVGGLIVGAGDAAGAETGPEVLHAGPGGSGIVCSAGRPCSVAAARQVVRERMAHPRRDVVVELAGGDYRMAAPMELDAGDSGAGGHTVTWRAERGARPRFTGAIRVTGWTMHDAGIWAADVPAGTRSRDMSVNGVRAERAMGLGCGKDVCKPDATGIGGVDPRIASFAHPEDLRLVTNSRWRDFHCGVTSVKGAKVTVAQPCWDNANAKTQTGWESASPLKGWRGVDWFENAYELLGQPGQFFLDQRENKLYYVPRPGENLKTADVELGVSEQLLVLKNVHDVAFEGLTFTGTTWRNPDTPEGYAGAQAGYYVNGVRTGTIGGAGEDYARTPAAVTVTGGLRVRFTGDTFTGLGGAGLALDGGTRDSVIENSVFTDIAGGGVFVGDTQHASRAKTAGNVVRGNTITYIGREFRDAVGIVGLYNDGLTVDRNTVEHVPYTGISVGWGWNFVGDTPTQRDILVTHNRIAYHMGKLYDGGAIYTQAVSPGSRVEGNDIDFAGTDHGNGIYHDEKSSYYTTTANVIRNAKNVPAEFNWISSWASWSTNLIIRGNWTDAPPAPPHNPGPTKQWGPNQMGLTSFPEDARRVIGQAGAAAPPQDRAVRFTQPTGTDLAGLTDIEVAAPFDTRSVRFSWDGTAFAEVTRTYADGTGLAPVWKTATDASWFTPGSHRLVAEAVTGQGTVTATKTVTTRRPPGEPGVTNLDGDWKFAPAAELPAGALDGDRPAGVAPGFDEGAMSRIMVPSSYGAVRARWNDDAGQLALYRKEFSARPGKQARLVFESCYFACSFFVNGTKVGSATGGYLPVELDVTTALRPGRNVLAVVLDNRVSTIRPYGINTDLYWNWGGLTQGVRLEYCDPGTLTGVTAQAEADGTLTVRADAANPGAGPKAVPADVTVRDPDGRIALRTHQTFTVPAGSDAADPVTLKVDKPRLWSMADPARYEVSVTPAAGRPVTTHAGFRTIAVRGSDVVLNGQTVRDLRGFNRHADYPGLGRTQPDGLAERELEVMRARGFTLFRPAHYPTTPAELDAADRLGILVLEEIPVTQANAAQLASEKTRTYAKDRLSRMIRRDRGHPSIFAWSVGNENATNTAEGASYVDELIRYGRTLDAQRLFTHVSAWFDKDRALASDDFVALNRYDGWYYGKATDIGKDVDTLQRLSGDKPLVLSEYGAEAVKDRPGTGKGTERYQAEFVDIHNRQLEDRPHFLGQMYWTSTEFALTPAGGGGNPIPVPGFHNKGLLTYDRAANGEKLAWRVLTSPVRITAVTARRDGGEAVLTVRLTSVSGRASEGNVLVGSVVRPFRVPAGQESSVELRVPTMSGEVRAVVDEHTEALPREFTTQ